MKVLIDIPEELVNDTSILAVDINYIKNGIVLPDEHGDLIDRDELKIHIPLPIEDEYKTIYRIIANAPAVIPADKENEE